jgi:4-alpha-glucanotransferase
LGGEDNPHLSHNIRKNSVVYSGTHDNDTTLGWWENDATDEEKDNFKNYFDVKGKDIISEMFKGLYRTVAQLAIVPIQDFLMQGSQARMNTPSVAQGNWQYQLKENDLSEERATWMLALAVLYGRSSIQKKKNNKKSD